MDGSNSGTDTLRDMLFNLPGGTGANLSREMQDVEGIRNRAATGDAATMSPQELHAALWKVLVFRDNVVKGIENVSFCISGRDPGGLSLRAMSQTIEKIPGLSSLVEKLTDSVRAVPFSIP